MRRQAHSKAVFLMSVMRRGLGRRAAVAIVGHCGMGRCGRCLCATSVGASVSITAERNAAGWPRGA